MDILHKIHDCTTIDQLDDLRDEIHLASSFGKIDFKVVKAAFLKKKAELEGKA